MRAILLHGFRVSDGGAGSIDRLRPYLEHERFVVRDIDYGRYSFLRVRLCNGSVARALAGSLEPDDVLIGHSNGACIALEAAIYARCRVNLVLINAARDCDADIPAGAGFAHVYHNPGDSPVWWSRLLLWHPWGTMGRDGWRAKDPRITNVDTASHTWPRTARGHSGIFAAESLAFWGKFIARAARVSLGALEPSR